MTPDKDQKRDEDMASKPKQVMAFKCEGFERGQEIGPAKLMLASHENKLYPYRPKPTTPAELAAYNKERGIVEDYGWITLARAKRLAKKHGVELEEF